MAYKIFLLLHSWVRWGILLMGIGLALRSWAGLWKGGRWTPWDARILQGFHHLIEVQAVAGSVLFAILSPLTQLAFSRASFLVSLPTVRFFTAEHVPVMIAALMWAYMGSKRSLRQLDQRSRWQSLALTLTGAMLLMAAAIPWPFLSYGRPLWRGF